MSSFLSNGMIRPTKGSLLVNEMIPPTKGSL
jgi:hypothetical protein